MVNFLSLSVVVLRFDFRFVRGPSLTLRLNTSEVQDLVPGETQKCERNAGVWPRQPEGDDVKTSTEGNGHMGCCRECFRKCSDNQKQTKKHRLTEQLLRGPGEQLIEHVEVSFASRLLDNTRFLQQI